MHKPPPHGQRSKLECAALTSSFDRNNSDGKASLTEEIVRNYNGVYINEKQCDMTDISDQQLSAVSLKTNHADRC